MIQPAEQLGRTRLAPGDPAMTATRPTLKQKAAHELREYFILSLYLFVVFSLLVVHKSMILAEHHLDYALHGFALINALALAKVMLVAQNLHLGDQFGDSPLIYPTLLKSFAFALLLTCFKVAEDVLLGKLHGKTMHESLVNLGGGSWSGILILSSLVCVMLLPFFGFTELRRVFGADRLMAVFFRPRHLWDVPPASS
jgi:hypothetical protein